jgi:hypothetical protein
LAEVRPIRRTTSVQSSTSPSREGARKLHLDADGGGAGALGHHRAKGYSIASRKKFSTTEFAISK